MEDYGYTFKDLNGMTENQKNFLILAKIERMKDENKAIEEQNKAAKKSNKTIGSQNRRKPRR